MNSTANRIRPKVTNAGMIGLFAQAFLNRIFAKELKDYGGSFAGLQTGKWLTASNSKLVARHCTFSPCGRRWREAPDEGSRSANSTVRNARGSNPSPVSPLR